MAKSKSKNKVVIETAEIVTLEDLAARISHVVEHDDAAHFIALLESNYQSWEVTEQLIRHFKALEVMYNKEIDKDEREDLSPKSLLKK